MRATALGVWALRVCALSLAARTFVAIRLVSGRTIPVRAAACGGARSAGCFFDGYARTKTLAFTAVSSLWSVRIGDVAVGQPVLDRDRNIFIDRARVSLLFINTEFGQQIQYDVRLDFELPGQLINSDLQLHRLVYCVRKVFKH